MTRNYLHVVWPVRRVFCIGLLLCLVMACALSQPPAQTPPSDSVTAQLQHWKETGEAALRKDDSATAEKAWQAGLEKAQAAGDQTLTAYFLNSLGILHYRANEYEKALNFAQQALALREKLQVPADMVDSLTLRGDIYSDTGELDKAEKDYLRSLALAEPLPDKVTLGKCLNNLGVFYDAIGQFDKSIAMHKRALALREQLGNTQDIADSLNNLGNVYDDNGEFTLALTCAHRALALREQLGRKADIARSYNNLGGIYMHLGRFDRAIDFHTRGLAIKETLGLKADISNSLSNLGVVYYSLGRFDKALDYTRRALAIDESLNNRQNVADSLSNIGSIYQQLGRLKEAFEASSRALAIRLQLKHGQDIAATLINLGNVRDSEDRYSEAIAFHRRALAILKTQRNTQMLSECLQSLGDVYQHQKRFDLAESTLNRTLALRLRLSDRKATADTLASLSDVYLAQHRLDRAESAFARARLNFEAASELVGDVSQMGAFQGTIPHFYPRYAALLLKKGRPFDALVMVERGRGRGLARQPAQSHADLERLLNAEDANRWQTALREFSKASNQWRSVELQPIPEDAQARQQFIRETSETAARYHETERRLTLLRDALYGKYPAYRRVQGAKPPTAADLRALARQNPDTLFLEWAVVGDQSTLLFALSQQSGLRAFVLPVGEAVLTREIAAWRRSILDKRPDEPRRARALYARLFGKSGMTRLLNPAIFHRLVLVADGPLLDMPFAALMDGGGHRLVERFALTNSVSLGVLLWPKEKVKASSSLLAAVDPVGSKGAVFRSAWRGGFGALPYARQEGAAVVGLFPGGVALVGAEAREAVIKREMRKYALLHFATHGALDASNGLRSGLILAPEPEDSPEDGILEAREILGMHLNAQMATLSACETAQGQPSSGEGVLGLTWAFRAAGCPSVLASQWSVDDAATGKLMVAFYREMKTGRTKDEALRRAMQKLRTDPVYRAPFYWAGFQMLGDSSPLPARMR